LELLPNFQGVFEQLVYWCWEDLTKEHSYNFHMSHEPLFVTLDRMHSEFKEAEAMFRGIDYHEEP